MVRLSCCWSRRVAGRYRNEQMDDRLTRIVYIARPVLEPDSVDARRSIKYINVG